jgi:hypothetical protein
MPYLVKVTGQKPRAVATLEEARRAIAETSAMLEATATWVFGESGGTVGPLPDGAAIEVTPISWDALRRDIGAVGRRGVTNDPAQVARADQLIAAFNAKQAGQ